MEKLRSDEAESFADWTVGQLKEYLRKTGGRLSGKKSDLVDRAIFYSRNQDASTTKQFARSLARGQGKLQDSDRSQACKDLAFPTSGWSSSPEDLPLVTAATVLGQLLRTGKCESTAENEVTVVQRPLRRGQDFFFGGYIHDVKSAREEGKAFVLSKCWASQKKRVKYEQKVLLIVADSKVTPAQVDFATCRGCPAGENGGLCHHVFALLIAIEHYGRKSCTTDATRHLPGPESVTSLPRAWGPRQRNVDPKPVMQTVVEQSKLGKERKRVAVGCSLYEARGPEVQAITQAEIEQLRTSLDDSTRLKPLLPFSFQESECSLGVVPGGSVMSYQLVEEPIAAPRLEKTPMGPSTVKAVSFPALPLAAQQLRSPCADVVEWPLDLSEAQETERTTVGQSCNERWKALHTHVLTASNFKKAARSTAPSEEALSRIFDSPNHVPAIQHGRKFEGQAIRDYEVLMASLGTPVHVRGCGIALHTQYRYLGASPDGLVFEPSASPRYGLLEVKCPHTAYVQSMTVDEACQVLPHFFCELVEGKVQLQRTHAYYYQVQGQMGICHAQWCDFLVWVGVSMSIERIKFDHELWNEEILPQLLRFCKLFAFPFLAAKNRPTPQQEQLWNPNGTPPADRFERLLHPDLCQSRIDGRNGSSACTVICTVFARKLLSDELCGVKQFCDIVQDVMCDAMREGNELYDNSGAMGCLSVDEVLDMHLVDVQLGRESFVSPSGLPAMVDFLHDSAGAAEDHLCAGVLVIHPYSFAVASDGTQLILLDSHTHGDSGASIAFVPFGRALDYFKYFFQHHYPHLKFDAEADVDKVGHLSLLELTD